MSPAGGEPGGDWGFLRKGPPVGLWALNHALQYSPPPPLFLLIVGSPCVPCPRWQLCHHGHIPALWPLPSPGLRPLCSAGPVMPPPVCQWRSMKALSGLRIHPGLEQGPAAGPPGCRPQSQGPIFSTSVPVPGARLPCLTLDVGSRLTLALFCCALTRPAVTVPVFSRAGRDLSNPPALSLPLLPSWCR